MEFGAEDSWQPWTRKAMLGLTRMQIYTVLSEAEATGSGQSELPLEDVAIYRM